MSQNLLYTSQPKQPWLLFPRAQVLPKLKELHSATLAVVHARDGLSAMQRRLKQYLNNDPKWVETEVRRCRLTPRQVETALKAIAFNSLKVYPFQAIGFKSELAPLH